MKIAISLSPLAYQLVADEATRRKLAKESDAQVSACVREAILAHFGPGGAGTKRKK